MVNRIILYFKGLNEKELLLLFLGITFGLRLYAVLMAQGIANDSAGYGFMARDFLRGDVLKGLSPAFHPLYPYLISFLSPNATSVEITGRLISLFFGTVTLIPVFYLVKEAFGQREAIFSALFYSVHPYLVTYSGMLLSEATYWGLLTLSIYFFWFGLRRRKIYQPIFAGFLLALAYLTRPEGIGYLVVFLFWVVIHGGVKKEWFRKSVIIGGFIITFLIPSASYLISIHHETGQWLISKKAMEVQTLLATLGGEQKENSNTTVLLSLIRTFFRHIPFTIYHYLRAYHFTLWLLLFLGLVRVRQKNIKEEWFFASLVLFHLFSLATFTPSTIRFSVPIIPISLLWVGAGVMEIQRFLEKKNVLQQEKWPFYLIVLILLVQLPQDLVPERWHRREQKSVGMWLSQNTPEGSVMMSNSPQEAFYANRPFIQLPQGMSVPGNPGESYREVIDFAKKNKVRYILVDRYTKEFSADFADSISSSLDLREFHKYKDKKGNMTVVYEVLD